MSRLKRVGKRKDDALARTHWAQVETLLADFYRRAGFAVDHCGTGSTSGETDGGIDLKLRRDNDYILVQCKHWNALQVPHNDVHQLLGIMVNEGATGAILVTSGEFTRAAKEAATRQGHVQLVDGDELRGMLGPLPEPKGQQESRARDYASSVARYVGERLLNAAEDRIRGGGGRRASMAKTAVSIVLVKLTITAVALLIGWMLLSYAINSLLQAQGALLPQPPPASQPKAELATNPVIVPDVVKALPVRTPPTPEEIRESQRRADEAMKVIEASTPEM